MQDFAIMQSQLHFMMVKFKNSIVRSVHHSHASDIVTQFNAAIQNNFRLVRLQAAADTSKLVLVIFAEVAGFFIIAASLIWITPLDNSNVDTALQTVNAIYVTTMMLNQSLGSFIMSVS